MPNVIMYVIAFQFINIFINFIFTRNINEDSPTETDEIPTFLHSYEVLRVNEILST